MEHLVCMRTARSCQIYFISNKISLPIDIIRHVYCLSIENTLKNNIKRNYRKS
jgi:hypothetical protein